MAVANQFDFVWKENLMSHTRHKSVLWNYNRNIVYSSVKMLIHGSVEHTSLLDVYFLRWNFLPLFDQIWKQKTKSRTSAFYLYFLRVYFFLSFLRFPPLKVLWFDEMTNHHCSVDTKDIFYDEFYFEKQAKNKKKERTNSCTLLSPLFFYAISKQQATNPIKNINDSLYQIVEIGKY